jgi:chromosome segregation ATPase
MVPFPSPVRTPVPAPFDPTEMRAPDLGVDFPGETRSIGPHQIDSKTEMPEPDIDDRDLPVEPPTPLPEEETAAETGETRPGDLALLRSQLSQQDDLVRQRDELASRVNELSTAAQERDDARHEAALLRARLIQAGDPMAVAGADSASTEELARAIEDRDHARRDYALLREQFETMKHEQLRARQEAPRRDPDAQREVELLRAQLAEREEELNSLKIDPMGVDPEIDSLREESDLLQKQLNKAREEASIAQRGLALSQKALQETRDALRESSEGTSQMRASLESLKNEYATLVQQNTLLQAQYDQLTREVSTLRTKSLRSGSKV